MREGRNNGQTRIDRVYALVLDVFNHDRDRANTWWMQKQEILGGFSPYEMTRAGMGKKIIRIIERCLP